jgi:glutaryl-CoA dehydrogenase (non-decarboxylating)
VTPEASAHIKGGYRRLVAEYVLPHARSSDCAGRLDPLVVEALRQHGWLGAPASPEHGGGGLDMVSYGLLTGEVGRACSSARTLLTVHNLVALTVQRWAGPALRRTLLPLLAQGKQIAALALSEPDAGSDIQAINSTLIRDGESFRLNGVKTWTSFGLLADWFLVFARSAEGAVALMISADAPGLSRQAITDVIGTRASMLAELHFDNCMVQPDQIVGRPGFGLSHVAATALDHGRYSVAWGAVGLIDACLVATLAHLAGRRQFGERMLDLPLARAAISRIFIDSRAARQLCLSAGILREARDPEALLETMVAKCFAAAAAVRCANAAVRLHGARGLSEAHDVERLLRDAKVIEIVEGSEEIHELLIASQITAGAYIV